MTAPLLLDPQATPTTTDDDLQSLLVALETAILGAPGTLPGNGPLSNPRTASAFVPGSTFKPVDLGGRLWAVARASADGANQVLCVHNPTDHPVTFSPDRHFADRTGQLLFLHGSAYAGTDGGQTTCRVDARSFVWLARFTDSRNTDSTGEPR